MLTPAQLSALDLSAHTAIIANAGSGKTRVLVERYLKILTENSELHPRNVVAITFTDSSARDLKKKIAEKLNQLLKDLSAGTKRDRLLEIKRQLGSAYISTIHSFCIQLLRTYPVEANVDASFTILTSPEDQLLLEESVRSSFYDILKKAYADENSSEAALLPVFRLFGRRKITSLIYSFLGSRFRIRELINNLYSSSDEQILKLWNDEVQNILDNEILEKVDITFFKSFFSDSTVKGSIRQRALDALLAYQAASTNIDKLRVYPELINSFFTKECNIRAVFLIKGVGNDYQNEAEIFTAPFIKYGELLSSYLESLNDPSRASLYLNYSRQLLKIFSFTLTDYIEQKSNYSLLDYEDVIETALRLVQIPEIQAELVKRFAHILIDEYQDTDAAQYAIAKALSGNFQSENRLTIVGDPKQSIYSFRNADLELYTETVREISAVNTKKTPVVLSETFRILSAPLAAINIISDSLFSGYRELIEGRNDPKQGSVELILPPLPEKELRIPEDGESGEPEDEVSADEVELIALKIKQIVADKTGKYAINELTDDKNINRPPRYNEIAILLRSRTHQSKLESELRKNNIPFAIYGGRGFYSSAEIIDITNYLRFLINSNDDIALAGVLRSPYFGLSDVDLYRLAPEKDSVTKLWQRLSLQITKDKHLIRAQEQLSENLQLVGRVSTQLLLQKIITESGIFGILQALPDGDQKTANLEKYLRFALAFGKEGYSGTFDFIERMTLLMERDEMEAQAEPKQDLNAVHLMTIHNAKGLEFPIVFLPYLHSSLTQKNQRRIWNTLDKELGIAVDLPEQAKKQPVVELIRIRSKEREIEEEKRIFYVAMTRARDHLILSASGKKNFNNTRIDWVLNSLKAESADASSIDIQTTITRYRQVDNSSSTYTEPIQFTIPIIRKVSDIPFTPERIELQTEVINTLEFLLHEVQPSESIGRYSPSQLLTFLECPTKYYLRYQLGLPEDEKLPYYNEANILAENVQGSLFGQIIHKILERSDSFINNDTVQSKLLEEVFISVCNDLHLPEQERKKYLGRVRADILNVIASPLGKEALHAKQYHSELALRSKLGSGQMLSGIIDRLFLDSEGLWNILDYKTDTRENLQKKKRYEFQLQFYAYLVSLLYSQDTVKAHVLYTHTGNTLSFTFTQKDFQQIGTKLESLVSQIREQKKTESLDLIELNLSHCPECHYFDVSRNVCIAGLGKEPAPVQTELLFTA